MKKGKAVCVHMGHLKKKKVACLSTPLKIECSYIYQRQRKRQKLIQCYFWQNQTLKEVPCKKVKVGLYYPHRVFVMSRSLKAGTRCGLLSSVFFNEQQQFNH